VDAKAAGLLRELVAIPSMNPYRTGTLEAGFGEERLARHVAACLEAAGLRVELSEVLAGRPNVVATLGGEADVAPLLFVAHLDTVPVEGMTIAPFEARVKGGRLHGRGACDNKGSMAAMMAALRRVAAGGTNPGPIVFAATADEESGFRGIQKLVADGVRARAAFVGEPTGLAIIIAHRGVVRWSVATSGTSAHSSHPEQGVNAIYRMAPLVGELERLAGDIAARPAHPLVGPPTLSVGTIHGGHSVNTVPDGCAIEVDRRFLPGDSPDDAEREVRALVERHPGATLERFLTAPAFEIAPDASVVGMARDAVAAVAGEARTVGVAYGTEAPHLHNAGIPAVVLGPGDGAQAHSADEFIDLAQLEAAARVYEHLMTQPVRS